LIPGAYGKPDYVNFIKPNSRCLNPNGVDHQLFPYSNRIRSLLATKRATGVMHRQIRNHPIAKPDFSFRIEVLGSLEQKIASCTAYWAQTFPYTSHLTGQK